ncbi:MAG: helicase DnaB [Synechococcaceae cyanobacterium]
MAAALRPPSPVLLTERGLLESVGSRGSDPSASPSEGLRPDPLDFSPSELRELHRRFGVHGPQPRLAQLFTEGLDQFQPLRAHTMARLEELRPVILRESARHRINPMLVCAVLFDEMQHAKPGENMPLAAHSGLFSTHGPAQLSLGELVKQGLLPADASPEEQMAARDRLLDPDGNVAVLVGKFVRLRRELGLPSHRTLSASRSPRDAKALATLAYLHNGKLDYPGRILRHMQDPGLHAVLYGVRREPTSPLI